MDKAESYLLATELCDFDREPAIRARALDLTRGCSDRRQGFERLSQFVKGMPYGLEDWDVKASQTLRKGWGMCCGKANLLVAMSRAVLIPARYRVFRIKAERRLLSKMAEQDGELAAQLVDLPEYQDHLECEVLLDGMWESYDPSRDYAMENAMRKLGIPLERQVVTDVDGVPRYVLLASIDEWARNRQASRRFRVGRDAVFARLNEQLVKIRNMA